MVIMLQGLLNMNVSYPDDSTYEKLLDDYVIAGEKQKAAQLVHHTANHRFYYALRRTTPAVKQFIMVFLAGIDDQTRIPAEIRDDVDRIITLKTALSASVESLVRANRTVRDIYSAIIRCEDVYMQEQIERMYHAAVDDADREAYDVACIAHTVTHAKYVSAEEHYAHNAFELSESAGSSELDAQEKCNDAYADLCMAQEAVRRSGIRICTGLLLAKMVTGNSFVHAMSTVDTVQKRVRAHMGHLTAGTITSSTFTDFMYSLSQLRC